MGRTFSRRIVLQWTLCAVLALPAPGQAAVRHRISVGTITQISQAALRIHSKTHNSNATFRIDGTTKFLDRGQPIPRVRFKVGTYVTVSYATGAHGAMIAYHISLRHGR
jgi:hypothetical protein